MERKTCTCCLQAKPLAVFRADKRRPDGKGSTCKECEAANTAARRRGDTPPKPGALVLVMPPRPAPPEPVGWELPPAPRVEPPRLDHYAAAAEEFIAALDPPAGPGDALLVAGLRDVSHRMDMLGVELEPGRDLRQYMGVAIRFQRELAATRSTKAATRVTEPERPSKFASFRDAL